MGRKKFNMDPKKVDFFFSFVRNQVSGCSTVYDKYFYFFLRKISDNVSS